MVTILMAEERWVRFGEWVKSRRKANELTQTDVASAAEITRQHVSDIEKGVSGVKRDTLVRIAMALHANVNEALRMAGFAPTQELTYEPDEDLEVLAAYRGLGDMKPTIKAMILAAHREHQRSQTTFGRRVAEERAAYDANEDSQEG